MKLVVRLLTEGLHQAAPVGIYLRILKNVRLTPICAFLAIYNKLPNVQTLVRFPSPALTRGAAPIEPTLAQRVLGPRDGPFSKVERIATEASANGGGILQTAINDMVAMSSHTACERIAER
jgi:hypothetical protein